ncbi:MAG: CCA tRNA nucleotidyltransferase [Clostridia bacterium]|nr:CCA tRNA nucleotidyltransferase [Clostridia bacterium]
MFKRKEKTMDLLQVMPRGAAVIINKLESRGHGAYVVGGCVRDALTGGAPNDWDICTSAIPEEIIDCFGERYVIKTGIKHGTVTVKAEDGLYEVTTFRIDGVYKDGRRPESVEFVSDIRTDLSRRDFTVNAMAYNAREGIVDPFGGREDLANGIIRCVGSPERRFGEDALRILRALRFASVLGFEIERGTAEAVHALKHLLEHIAKERIRDELLKLCSGKNAYAVLWEYRDVITAIIPELAPCIGFEQHNRYHCYDVYCHIIHAVANYRGGDDAVAAALLLHDIEKPACFVLGPDGVGHCSGHAEKSSQTARAVYTRLRFSRSLKESAAELIKYHDAIIEPNKKSVRKWMRKLGEKQFMRLIDMKRADMFAQADIENAKRSAFLDELRDTAKRVIATGECYTLRQLALKGGDIKRLGVRETEIGEILGQALDAVIDEKVPNEKLALIEYLRRTGII